MAASREIGTLIVVVLKARNLPNKRHIGKQDPYCLVSLNGEKRRTKAIKRGGQHPEWDEEIRFTLLEDDTVDQPPPSARNGSPPPPPPKKDKSVMNIKGGKFMGLACYAEDLREPDLIGETKVDLTEVLTKGETDEWFTLMSKDKYCGEVYLELTFWSNEPVPTKKAPAKHKTKKNYGGPGSFVPSEGPTHSSSENLTEYSHSSRLSSSNSIQDRSRRESLPPSLRSSSSIAKIDLYTAPYETNRSHSSISTFDSLASELGQLNVSGDLSRRTSYATGSSGFQPRPASANGYPTSQSSQFGYSQYSHYSNEGSSYEYDQQPVSATATGFSQYPQQNTLPPQPASYHPPYETPGRPSSAYPGARGPRHSLPSASSGFMPIPTPQPSGFAPVAPQNTGYYPPPVPATPAPSNYGPPASHTPPGQAPPSHLYNQHSQHNAYPPAPTPAPSSSFSVIPQYNNMSPTYPQSYQPMPPSQPTYSYQYPNAHNQVQQQYAPPPMPPPTTVSAPPSMNGTGPPQSVPPPPPLPAPTHQHTGSPEHLHTGYGEQMQHPPPSHISIPPPPPLTQNVPSPVSGGGSRPLPVPGQSQVRRKPSSIGQQQPGPISPNGAQPNYNAYAQVPPPPPLPTSSSVSSLQTRPPSAVPPPSVLSQPYAPVGHQMSAIPGPPPLPPPRAPSRAPSQSLAQPQYNHVPARRHSVSHTSAIYVPPPPQPVQPPPEQYQQQQQQQNAYQAVPPPPPLTYGGTTSHTLALAASSLQASQHPYPGPLPVPPQIPTSQSMHGYPVASGSWQ